MPIEKTSGYKVGTIMFATLKEAQLQALTDLVGNVPPAGVLDTLVAQADKVVAILSKPKELRQRKRRSDYGVKKTSAT